ncbi:MAG TPA: TetR family transcriptional regulator [Burkholderiaceae bacterium]
MGRKPNTESRRRQIIDALFVEIAEMGYQRASTVSIAARAGLAPGLIHYHFESKEDILIALVDELIAFAELAGAAAMDAAPTAATKLKAYVSARVGFGANADASQVKAWVGILAEAMNLPSIRERVAQWLAADHALLANLFEESGAKQSREHASMLLAAILGSFTLHSLAIPDVPTAYAEGQLHAWLDALAT